MKLRMKHLPHTVTLKRFAGATAEGEVFETGTKARAYVEQKSRLKVDRRAASPSFGQEIVSSTMVILLTEDDVLPGSKVTVWEGTARERESVVIDSALFDYRGTPNHVELFLE